MCGICGYVGNRRAAPILSEMLEIMERHRLGFESAGIATIQDNEIALAKKIGAVREVFPAGGSWAQILRGQIGIGHTRYPAKIAPVGKSKFVHPFYSCDRKIALIHNGVIYNYEEIWRELPHHEFSSFDEELNKINDSEVIVHLLEEEIAKSSRDIAGAVSKTCERLSRDPRNSYLFAFLFLSQAAKIYAVSGRGDRRKIVVANKRGFGSIFASYRDYGIEGREALGFEAIKPYINLDQDKFEVLPFDTLAILTKDDYDCISIRLT